MKLSVCMIVKNEERRLFGLLTYLRSFVDEICVVDTGSSDLTKKICHQFADKVKCIDEFKDFSHARNLSISLATGDWILILDADEFIFMNDYIRLKEYISQSTPLAARMIRYNYVGDGMWSISNIIRIIKNDGSVYFTRAVHESVRASLKGYSPDVVGVELHHIPNNIGKNKVYTNLLSSYLSQHADDVHAEEHFAGELAAVGNYTGAIEKYVSVLNKKPDLIRAYINLAFVALKSRQEEIALQYLNTLNNSILENIDDNDKAEIMNCYTMIHFNKHNYEVAYSYACKSLEYSSLSHLQLNKAYLQYLLGENSGFQKTRSIMFEKNKFLFNSDIYVRHSDMNNSIYNIDIRNIVSPKVLFTLR